MESKAAVVDVKGQRGNVNGDFSLTVEAWTDINHELTVGVCHRISTLK